MITLFRQNFLLCLTCFILNTINVTATEDSIIKQRFIPLMAASAIGYTAGIYWMNELWYKDNPRTTFHFFNDSREWAQMDKAGHAFTSFAEGVFALKTLKWAGVSDNKAVLWGSLSGVFLQAPIELLDGFAKDYGASVTDLAANTAGGALLFVQFKLWNSIKIQPKFSFHQTKFASQRPNLFGKNYAQQMIKDYNGQTYWLAFNLYSLFFKGSSFPQWLAVSLGYGADNMLYANKETNLSAGLDTYRQYYLSLDLDLSAINTRKKLIRVVLDTLNYVHLPFPSLEINRKGLILHPIYF